MSPLKSRPTTLIISRQIGKQNIIAVAWVAPQDFDPPKITIVIDKNTYTRERVEASGGFAINVPCLAQMDTLHIVGTSTGRDLKESDKFALYHLHSFPAKETAAPLLKGCVAWLECKFIPEQHCQDAYDLFVVEVVAAYADERVFSQSENGQPRWHFESHADLRSIHHVAGGAFFATSEPVSSLVQGFLSTDVSQHTSISA